MVLFPRQRAAALWLKPLTPGEQEARLGIAVSRMTGIVDAGRIAAPAREGPRRIVIPMTTVRPFSDQHLQEILQVRSSHRLATLPDRGVRRGANGGSMTRPIFLCVLALVARDAAAQTKTGTIAGTIVAREGGRPIPDAAVNIEGTSLTAVFNGVGRFRIDNVPTGPVALVATARGFCSCACPLLVDGVPQVDSRNSARTVGLPIHDATNIEVVRGPNSAIYGRTAISRSTSSMSATRLPIARTRSSCPPTRCSTSPGRGDTARFASHSRHTTCSTRTTTGAGAAKQSIQEARGGCW